MKTAVLGQDGDGLVIYNRALLEIGPALRLPAQSLPRPPAAKPKEVERPFRYIPRGFFLAGRFRNLGDLNWRLRHWLDTVANPRVHANTERVVNETFAEERSAQVSAYSGASRPGIPI